MSEPNEKNIQPRDPVDVMWDSADVMESLRKIRKTVEEDAGKAIVWYWKNKGWKCRLSRAIQFFALFLAALAGIAPIIVQVLKGATVPIPASFDSGAIASLCIGIAAALLGLDKAFGFSSGWTRYVLTATSMNKLLYEFRMDWVALIAVTNAAPTPEQQAGLIQRAKEFVLSIQGMVMQETKDWATEFQSNMAQVEKDLKTQLDTLKAQVEKNAKAKEDAAKPGAIELTLTNADRTDGFKFDVTLQGASSTSTDSVASAKVWTAINIAPGQYKVTLKAIANGSPVVTSTIVEIQPGETAKPSVLLPIS